VDRARKRELLAHLIHSQGWKQVLVFTRTKHGANRLAEQLEDDGIRAAAIHGNKSQGARTKALADFKKGSVRVLAATDIAARGLDIDQLPHVVNYELPNVPEDYVHRIGRTGRAGKEGEALSLVCVDEHDFLRDIERLLKRDIPKVVIPGFEPDPTIKAEPIVMGRRGQRGGRPQGQRHGGERAHSNPHRRDGGQHPQSNQHARSGGQRPHSPSHARPAAHRHDNRHAPRGEVDGNRRVDVEVDGNRRMPENRSSQAHVRSSFSKTERPARRHRSTSGKGTIRRSW